MTDYSKIYVYDTIKNGNIEDLQQFLKTRGHFITYAFPTAVNLSKVKMIEFLLEVCKANVDQDNGYGLYRAACHGNIEVVNVLLEHGANVSLRENGALKGAILYGHSSVVDSLLKYGAVLENTFLRTAVSNGYVDVVRVLLKHGATTEGILTIVPTKNSTIIFSMLIEHGLSKEDLDHIMCCKDVKIVALALKHGANPDVFDGFPLRNVVFENNVDICRLLLENGADLHRNNDNPLRTACCTGSFDVARLLLQYGADPTTNDAEFFRSVMENNKFEYLAFIALMLSHGADGSLLPTDVFEKACALIVDTKPALANPVLAKPAL